MFFFTRVFSLSFRFWCPSIHPLGSLCLWTFPMFLSVWGFGVRHFPKRADRLKDRLITCGYRDGLNPPHSGCNKIRPLYVPILSVPLPKKIEKQAIFNRWLFSLCRGRSEEDQMSKPERWTCKHHVLYISIHTYVDAHCASGWRAARALWIPTPPVVHYNLTLCSAQSKKRKVFITLAMFGRCLRTIVERKGS